MAGGHRLLRRWLCRPLCSIPAIEARLDAAEQLASQPGLGGSIRSTMKAVGDLERALGRVRNAAHAPAAGLPAWVLDQAQRRWARVRLSVLGFQLLMDASLLVSLAISTVHAFALRC